MASFLGRETIFLTQISQAVVQSVEGLFAYDQPQ